jgi:serine/threonine-protein kinase RsbW
LITEPVPRCDLEANKLQTRFTATIQAEVNAIRPIVDRILQVIRQMKCGAGKEVEIDLALQEALANAVIHGCGNDPSKRVEVCVACDESRGLLIVVRDPGPGFDPSSIPSPITGQNVFSDHGRGIFLVSQLMDEVHFERGGTEIHMRKF